MQEFNNISQYCCFYCIFDQINVLLILLIHVSQGITKENSININTGFYININALDIMNSQQKLFTALVISFFNKWIQ